MEKKFVSPSAWAMNAGAIIGLSMTACDYVVYWGLKHDNPLGNMFSIFTYIIFIVGIFYSQKKYRERTGGFIRYDKALGIGFLTSFYVSVVLGFYYFVIFKFDPGMIDQMMQEVSKIYGNNNALISDLNQNKEALTPVTLGLSIVFDYSLIGLLISFISSFIVKKINPAAGTEDTNQTDN